MNYGKLCILQKNFPQAETLLQKAVTVEPGNVESLMLLADAEYMNRHFDAAIVSARQAHSADKEHPSFVHYIAARSYQQENRLAGRACRVFNCFCRKSLKDRAPITFAATLRRSRLTTSAPSSSLM